MAEVITTQDIWQVLESIPDPEIPVINIVELGVARKVEIENDKVIVTITPTYSGCPAMKAIEQDIASVLKEKGYDAEIRMTYAPAWTTDWLTGPAKEKLRIYGIAPPEKASSDKSILIMNPKTIQCPRCASTNTILISQFGSTACKALYRCSNCGEPFDYFKCH
jgi:ring-1,2-phenylacetyl-CoA epoxidase subunit PaaD